MKVENKSFERVEQFKYMYLRTALTKQNLHSLKIEEQIELRKHFLSFGAQSFIFQFMSKKYDT